MLGFYISGHPLDPLRELVNAYGEPIRNVTEKQDGDMARLTGMISDITYKFSKTSGKQFGVMHIEDMDANCECMVYEKTLTKLREAGIVLEPGNPCVFEVTISKRDESEPARVMLDMAMPLTDAPQKLSSELYLHITRGKTGSETQKKLVEILRRHPGDVIVKLCMLDESDDSVVFLECRTLRVEISMPLLAEIDALLGKGHYRIKAKDFIATPRRTWRPKEKETEFQK